MKARRLILLCIVALAACDPLPNQKNVDVSPLTAFDKTRLWLLLRASPVGDGRHCAAFFQSPEDPRYRARAQRCVAWTLDFAGYLQRNGLATVQAVHLQDPVYWTWFETTRQSILACQQTYVPQRFNPTETQAQRLQRAQTKYACDPFDDAIKNKKQTPQDLGIRLRDTKAYSRLEDLSAEPSGVETP